MELQDAVLVVDGKKIGGGDTSQILQMIGNLSDLETETKDNLVAAINEIAQSGGGGGSSLVTIITDKEEYYGKTVTLSNGSVDYTGTFSEEGKAQVYVKFIGTYTATCEGNAIGSIKITTLGAVYTLDTSIKVFAFHYSENDSNPDSVTYPDGYDNSGWTDTFYVNLSTGIPHYGDWNPDGDNANAVKWLFPRSCMLKYDGIVDYYLDENNEAKKEDGTNSDVSNMSYAGNAMMEWGQDRKKIYWKIVPDDDGKGFTFVVANGDTGDTGMKPWNHYNCRGDVAEHFYTPKYFGSSDGTRLRSMSGGTNYVSHTGTDEIALAKKNNPSTDEIWNTEVYVDWLLIAMLEVLISKSMNTQARFGYGRCLTSNTSTIGQGTMNGKGMFWGSNDQTSGVKIFGMENPHGNLWRRIAGLINDKGTVKCKLTYTTEDGSSVTGYNTDGTGYITCGSIGGTNGGYISHMSIGKNYLVPSTISGSDSTYYTDGGWFNNSQVNYAFVGGNWDCGLRVGAFCCALNGLVSIADTAYGAAPSCKPLV